MNPTTHRFIEPLDVLFLRGNKLFGDPGSHGESLVPPWPSVAAGALRSLMLAADGVDIAAFALGRLQHATLGTPAAPGAFALTGFDLARRNPAGQVETLHALPADLLVTEAGNTDTDTDTDTNANANASPQLTRLQPQPPAPGLASSAPLALWPVLAQAERRKPVAGHWLTQAGWATYLKGQTPAASQLVPAKALWRLDARIGIGLDSATRSVADGQLFTAQAVAFQPGVGFLASVRGGEPPRTGVLRFGGDGRGAALTAVQHTAPQPDWEAISRAGRCRIVLTTPGLFAKGWLPPGVHGGQGLALQGISGQLVCAAVPRAEVISGWDLARRQPKAAERVAPTGSVYWIDRLAATPEQLRKLVGHGLWPDDHQNAARQAEGFNRFTFAAW